MDILFWSGGKDSYLALELHRRNTPQATIELLTTFDETSEIVPHQQIPINRIKKQAETLDIKLSLIPLPKDCPNKIYLEKINKALQYKPAAVKHLIFGDWHLQDIRTWRKKQFKTLGYKCLFPLWQKNSHELLSMLFLKSVEVRISAVAEEHKKFIKVGEVYDYRFVRQLPPEIDPLGEYGEFHTEVIFKSGDEAKPADQSLY